VRVEETSQPSSDNRLALRAIAPPAGGDTVARLTAAIVETVTYSDLFDYPLTAQEIHRYLAGVPASLAAVADLLSAGRLIPQRLERADGFYTLPGRLSIVDIRHRRTRAAAGLWAKAVAYGAQIARLPFVRMVAVTGALAVDNSDTGDDLDYLIVTEPGRLWLCRALVIGLVRLAQRRGDVICPNYFLSERALALDDHSLYTAREIAQMVPLTGRPIYHRLRQLNGWVESYLPNAAGAPRELPLAEPASSHMRAAVETVLRLRPAGVLERWEMRRKIRKLIAEHGATGADEASFSPEYCKGHFGGYGSKTLAAFNDRTIGS
jgi:hypothetical protein